VLIGRNELGVLGRVLPADQPGDPWATRGLHSAYCVLRSVDFAEIEELQRLHAWPQAGERLAGEARLLEAAGSELLVLCTNTMHKVADTVSSAVGIPDVHIADATADAVHAAGLSTVGLIATAYTMEQDFYVGRLCDMHGLRVLVPDPVERRVVHHVIYDELAETFPPALKADDSPNLGSLFDAWVQGIGGLCRYR
jgi:aspartate racemase